jgi:hypothetical protein
MISATVAELPVGVLEQIGGQAERSLWVTAKDSRS